MCQIRQTRQSVGGVTRVTAEGVFFVFRADGGGEAGVANGQVLAGNDQLHNRLHKLVAGALRKA